MFQQSQYSYRRAMSSRNRNNSPLIQLGKIPSYAPKSQSKGFNENTSGNNARKFPIVGNPGSGSKTDPRNVVHRYQQLKKKTWQLSSDQQKIVMQIESREKSIQQLSKKVKDQEQKSAQSQKLYQEALNKGDMKIVKKQLNFMNLCEKRIKNIGRQKSQLRAQISALKKQLQKLRDRKV